MPRTESQTSSLFSSLDMYDQTPPGEVDSEDEAQNLEPIRPNQEPTVAVIGVGYVGEHLVNANPFYLLSNNDFPLLQRATETMCARPGVLAQRIVKKLAEQYVGGARLKILVIGIGFKPGQAHLANSPGLELAKSLVLSGKVDMVWADTLVAQEAVPQIQRLEEAYWSVAFLEQNVDYIVAAMRPAALDVDILRRVPSKMVEWWFA
ncbi:hypothetical protein NHJ13051_006515 [Beauveria bassiana]